MGYSPTSKFQIKINFTSPSNSDMEISNSCMMNIYLHTFYCKTFTTWGSWSKYILFLNSLYYSWELSLYWVHTTISQWGSNNWRPVSFFYDAWGIYFASMDYTVHFSFAICLAWLSTSICHLGGGGWMGILTVQERTPADNRRQILLNEVGKKLVSSSFAW